MVGIVRTVPLLEEAASTSDEDASIGTLLRLRLARKLIGALLARLAGPAGDAVDGLEEEASMDGTRPAGGRARRGRGAGRAAKGGRVACVVGTALGTRFEVAAGLIAPRFGGDRARLSVGECGRRRAPARG